MGMGMGMGMALGMDDYLMASKKWKPDADRAY